MLNYFLVFFLIISTTITFGQDLDMNEAEIKDFKEQISTVSKSTTTITSDFIQYKHLDFLENDIETSGKLVFKAPDKVKWEYLKPYEYSVIFKKDMLLINDGGTKSNVDIGNSKLFKKLNELIINSVKGSMFDDDDFTITYLKNDRANKAIFNPRDKKIASYIASFELLFNKADGTVLEVVMVEPSKDFTRIVFSNRVLNSIVDEAVFTN